MINNRNYLISQDLWKLFKDWADIKKYCIPTSSYFDKISKGMVEDLQYIFNETQQGVEVKLVYFDDLSQEIDKKLSDLRDNTIISLDKAYAQSDLQLEINRVVSEFNGKWKDVGEHCRPGSKSINVQLDLIKSKVNGNPITVTDDGCWSGGSISKVVHELRKRNMEVEKVVVGLFIDGGEISPDIPLDYVYRYPADSIVDWICERDFFPGAPFGGRTVALSLPDKKNQDSYGAYYLFGMGNYSDWASLHFEKKLIEWFTQKCIRRSIELFETVEKLSEKTVLVKNLTRFPYGIKFHHNERFVDVLKRLV